VLTYRPSRFFRPQPPNSLLGLAPRIAKDQSPRNSTPLWVRSLLENSGRKAGCQTALYVVAAAMIFGEIPVRHTTLRTATDWAAAVSCARRALRVTPRQRWRRVAELVGIAVALGLVPSAPRRMLDIATTEPDCASSGSVSWSVYTALAEHGGNVRGWSQGRWHINEILRSAFVRHRHPSSALRTTSTEHLAYRTTWPAFEPRK